MRDEADDIDEPDDLETFIAERTAQNANFPRLVEEALAERRRARRAAAGDFGADRAGSPNRRLR